MALLSAEGDILAVAAADAVNAGYAFLAKASSGACSMCSSR